MVLLRRALAAMLMVGIVLVIPAGPARAVPAETGRYYVVGPAVDGQPEYLYAIALRTLGNGNRFREIVQLNKGRPQPGGETFTDGLVLSPGWLLVLPKDAKGQGVRIGPLPKLAPPPPSPPGAAPRPTTSRPSPPPRTTVPATRAPSASARTTEAATAAPKQTAAVAEPPRDTGPTANSLLVRGGAAALAVLLAVLALKLRRSGGRLRLALEGDDSWPPARHHTPRPTVPDDEPEMDWASAAPPGNPAPVPPPPSAEGPTAEVEFALPPPPTGVPAVTDPADRPAASAAPDLPAAPEPPVAPLPELPVGPAPDLSAEPRPALSADGEMPYLNTELETALGSIRVRLVGVAAGYGGPAYAWVGVDEPLPPATLPLLLGRRGPWRLHVDLGRTPDVLTLVGESDDCRRTALLFARGLRAAGIGVATVGAVLGTDVPEDCRILPGLPEPPAPGEELPEPYVVFTAGLPAESMVNARRLAAATRGRCVPVVIGPVPGSRWSVQVDPVRADHS